jgi:hypothetical protein
MSNPCCGDLLWSRVHSTTLKWSKYQTWVLQLSSLYQYPVARNLHKLESLTPYTNDYNQIQSKEGSIDAHRSTTQQQHTHKHKRERTNQNDRVTAQERAQISLTNQKHCRGVSELWCAQSMLRWLLHEHRGSFYSPKGSRSPWSFI